MGERKIPNKYIPPDFDPKKIPRFRKPKNHQKKIRFMLPVRVWCKKCGNYMSEGTKFNCREELVINETYLGIKIHSAPTARHPAELTIQTELKNSGYIVESGASGPYDRVLEKEEKHEGSENALESLEKRTMISKRDIEVMAVLDEMKSRRASVSLDSLLEALNKRRRKQEEENVDEELLIKSIKFGKRTRIDEEKNNEALDEKKKKKPKRRVNCTSPNQISFVRIVSKKTAKLTRGIESLCHNYGTDSDEEK
ncbi:hypothetical protein N665_0196s0010 [Sinapis alba]|nr:hypothetical protein N665_0196s0010 [Sinapis alba]